MIIDGKVAIVVGGAQGIGQAAVESLLEKGAKVCIADVAEAKGVDLAIELRQRHPDHVFFLKCDVTSDAEVEALFVKTSEQFGQRPEIVLTTVGILHEFNWQLCLDVNLGGCIRLINAALKYMGKDKGGPGGTVVVTSSISGLQPESWGPVYAATKHALVGLVRSWAEEKNSRSSGIRFNLLCPCAVTTNFPQQLDNTYHANEHRAKLQSADDILKPPEIAEGFVSLVEDDNANGRVLRFSKEAGTGYVTFPESINM